MSNVLWEWNKIDTSQFDPEPFTIHNGNKGPFTGSLSMEVQTFWGEPCIRIFGQYNTYKGQVWRVNDFVLPNRYQVEYEFLSSSYSDLVYYTPYQFPGGVAVFGTFDATALSNHYVMPGSYSAIFVNGTSSGPGINMNNSYGPYYCKAVVNHKPTKELVSGSFQVNMTWTNGLAQQGYNQHFPDVLTQGDPVSLSSSFQGRDFDFFGVGVPAAPYAVSTTGSVWLTNIRILKHPLDLDTEMF